MEENTGVGLESDDRAVIGEHNNQFQCPLVDSDN